MRHTQRLKKNAAKEDPDAAFGKPKWPDKPYDGEFAMDVSAHTH